MKIPTAIQVARSKQNLAESANQEPVTWTHKDNLLRDFG